MSPSPVRRIALELLGLAETSSHPLPDLIEHKGLELEAAGGGRDLGLLRHLVLGTLRQRGLLDALLGAVSKRPLADLEPQLRNLLRLGAFQLSAASRIPAHAAVHETVRLAKRIGHVGIGSFVNAVLRNLERRLPELSSQFQDPRHVPDPLDRLALSTSHPRWLLERWSVQLGLEAAARRAEWNNLEPPVDLRVNLAQLGPGEAADALAREKIEAVPLDTTAGFRLADSSDLPRVLGLEAGNHAAFYVQSRLSQLAAERAAALAAGPLVLDACAAPGGKSLVLSQRLPQRTRLMAYEQNEKRRQRLRGNFERLGLTQVELIEDTGPLEGLCALVLVDAPCTALGVLRRHPEIRWRRTPEDPARMGEVQRRVLGRFVRCLAPEGILFYTVCSFEPEETTAVTAALLAEGGLEPWVIPGADRLSGLTPSGLALYSFGTDSGDDGYYLAAFRKTPRTSPGSSRADVVHETDLEIGRTSSARSSS